MGKGNKNNTRGKSTGRPKPFTPKAGVTRSSKRQFSCGGSLKKK